MSMPSLAQPTRNDNPETVINAGWVVEPPWSFERLFFHHFEHLRELREINVATSGYAVVGIFANRTLSTYGWLTQGCGPNPDLWVFGRHRRCDLRLRGDPTVALRHLLVRLARDGSLVLDDLASGQGFDVGEVGRCHAASSRGMVCARVGSYALFFLPVEVSLRAHSPREAWERLTATGQGERASLVRRPSPQFLGERTRAPEGGAVGDEVVGNVIVSRDQIGSVYPVTAAELEQGLIFGRYRRCDVRVAQRQSWSAVSRVHAMLCRWEGKLWAFDLASTNGIKVEGRRVRCAPLGAPTRIDLGDGHRIYWRPERW